MIGRSRSRISGIRARSPLRFPSGASLISERVNVINTLSYLASFSESKRMNSASIVFSTALASRVLNLNAALTFRLPSSNVAASSTAEALGSRAMASTADANVFKSDLPNELGTFPEARLSIRSAHFFTNSTDCHTCSAWAAISGSVVAITGTKSATIDPERTSLTYIVASFSKSGFLLI